MWGDDEDNADADHADYANVGVADEMKAIGAAADVREDDDDGADIARGADNVSPHANARDTNADNAEVCDPDPRFQGVDEAAQLWEDDDTDADAPPHNPDTSHMHHRESHAPSIATPAEISTVNEAADAWGDESAAPSPEQMHGVDHAAAAWGDTDGSNDSDPNEEAGVDVNARAGEIHTHGEPDANIADHNVAAMAWGDESSADESVDKTDADENAANADANADADAEEIADADADADESMDDTDSDDNAPSLPTADDAANVWNSDDDSSGTGDAPDASSSRITLPQVYSASDFDFVDDSWLPDVPGQGEQDSDDDDDNSNYLS